MRENTLPMSWERQQRLPALGATPTRVQQQAANEPTRQPSVMVNSAPTTLNQIHAVATTHDQQEEVAITADERMAKAWHNEVVRLHGEMEALRGELRQQRQEYLDLLSNYRSDMAKKDEQLIEQLTTKDAAHREDMNNMIRATLMAPDHHMPTVPIRPTPATPSQQSKSTKLREPAAPSHAVEKSMPHTITPQDTGQLLYQLQTGADDGEAVVMTLEHALEVLESLVTSLPRKQRKAIKAQCAQVDQALEVIDKDTFARLRSCPRPDLMRLCEKLGHIQALHVGKVGTESVSVVSAALAELQQCGDVVTWASRQLSLEHSDRCRGLEALRSLERVALREPKEAEVAAATAAGKIAHDIERCNSERTAAWLSTFTLCFRNGTAAEEVVLVSSEGFPGLNKEVFSGQLEGKEGVAVWAAATAFSAGFTVELGTKSETAAMRKTHEKACMGFAAAVARLECTRERMAEILPLLLSDELSANSDLALATGALAAVGFPVIASNAACSPVAVGSPELPAVALTLMRRIQGNRLRQTASWWQERANGIHLDSIYTSVNVCVGLCFVVPMMSALPLDRPHWEELLAEGIHICKINKEAELSAQETMPWHIVQLGAKLVSVATREQSRHVSLVAAGVVEPLLYMTSHDYGFIGSGIAEYAAGAVVALIGKNEGGLTLTRGAVNVVLNGFQEFWNTTSTHWRVKSAAKAPVKKIVGKALPIVDMVISDANKPFVVEHESAIDDLVQGLLVNDGNSRRTQDGADKLQEICTQALQNLALSDICKEPLRSHPQVIPSLRVVATAEGGKSDQARQYASGALFELDEVVRQKARDAAVAAKAKTKSAATTASSNIVEHVMLSYNWSHQTEIKRINTALKAHGYSIWIDIEKMQGSTVEAMADAVEDAAVMCYGISEAYKESTNCRMEAQYAFQQQKDMVPLMMQEGYNAKGWLGMILGVRLWYGFFGSVLENEALFEGKIKELCRELGERGKTEHEN